MNARADGESGPVDTEPSGAARALRTPRAAAVAGIVFSVLLLAALIIIRIEIPTEQIDAGRLLTQPERRRLLVVALNLVPFAGIAFLWFIGAVRDHLGDAEDRFFATVFLGSGLLFIAMLFVGAAVGSGLLAAIDSGSPAAELSAWQTSHEIAHVVLTVYAMRMAAVFTISTTSIAHRLAVIPRWLMIYGYVTAVVLMLAVGFFAWIELIFPIWVFVISAYLLQTRMRRTSTA